MNLITDTLTAGKKAIEQWRPTLEAAVRPGSSESSDASVPTSKFTDLPQGEWPPPLSKALDEVRALNTPAVLLGVGEDRLPFHLDLSNPASGALLVCGDSQAGVGSLLRSILASAAALNKADCLSISVIALHVDDYSELAAVDHCHEVIPAEDEISGELIQELADIADARRTGKSPQPILLLVIDDLTECLEYLSEAAYARLYRLIRHGPRYGVWTFAGLKSERMGPVGSRFLSAFRTRLIGHIKDRKAAAELSQDRAMHAESLHSGEFFLPYGSEWMRFWACPAEGSGASAND